VLRRSSVGLLFTSRSVGEHGAGANTVYGIDSTFAFFTDLTVNSYWATTRTNGVQGDEASYRTQVSYTGDRYGAELERLVVGGNFNPEIGFVRRDDMRRNSGQLRFSPRPRSIGTIRKFSGIAGVTQVENGVGRVETRDWKGEFAIEFQNSDRFSVSYGKTFEVVPQAFPIAPGVSVPIGSYDFATVGVGLNLGAQRRQTGNILVEYGTFYSGHKTSISMSQGRVSVSPQLLIEPTYAVNRVELVEHSFTSHLLGSRITYTMTPMMFATLLLQYNSIGATMTANVRLRWEYHAGSEVFVVYNEGRDTAVHGFPALANRTLIIKINRLFRF
jgi:hypothetical protein